ncbi:hypothetical protein AGDE_02592 [Angomonas deanei]|nr:hypothetical protein AGDE_02592 [Angomonas deanei]|eukprot:EPY41333.1 hypothetical protein AGDE_02592 [Angomonas deanei]
MMFRESQLRMVKDQFILPSSPTNLEDSSPDWNRLLRRRGVRTEWPDLTLRLNAMRSLFAQFNLLLIPKEGGGVAEVEGPPGPRRWYLLVYQQPKTIRHLLDALELPMETALSQLIPFRRLITPDTETFRFDNTTFLVPCDKIFDVSLTISTEKEQLVWVSPMEALARFNAGVMNMPTANVIALSELANECPTYADVLKKTAHDTPRPVQPELFRHGQTKVATVVLPGDVAHSQTTEEDRQLKFVRRFVYEKDFPHGVRAVFDERPASEEELALPLVKDKPALLEEANENDLLYMNVPYPERKQSLHTEGKTQYAVPQHRLSDGAENEEGFIPVRRNLLLERDDGDEDFVNPFANLKPKN